MAKAKKQKKRLLEIAYDTIKDAIIHNEIKPGTMLSEKQLCESLKMSRTPVREALRMLETEDLIEVRDGVGTFVKERSQKDIEDAYELRMHMEVLAIQTAIYEFTEEELGKLEQCFREMDLRYRSGATLSIEEYGEADWNLHDMIVRKSKNRYVKIVMDVIRTPLKRYQSLSVKVISNIENSMQEHLEIIEAIRKQDLPQAQAILERHIQY